MSLIKTFHFFRSLNFQFTEQHLVRDSVYAESIWFCRHKHILKMSWHLVKNIQLWAECPEQRTVVTYSWHSDSSPIFIWRLQSSTSDHNPITLPQLSWRLVFGPCKDCVRRCVRFCVCVCARTFITQMLHQVLTYPLSPYDPMNTGALEIPIQVMEVVLSVSDWTRLTCFVLIPGEERGLCSPWPWNQSKMTRWWTAALQ